MARPTKIKGSQYPYARKVVPADVRAILGRTEFKQPLHGTEAQRSAEHGALISRWEGQIAAARASLHGDVQRLSQKQVLTIAGQWYRERAAEYEEDPGRPEGWDAWGDILIDRVPVDENGRRGTFEPNAEELAEAEGMLRERGIAADRDSVERTAIALWDCKLSLASLMERRANGDYSPDKLALTFPEPVQPRAAPVASQEPLRAADVIAQWERERTPSQGTVKKYQGAFRRVALVLGFDDLRRITVEGVRQFKEARFKQKAPGGRPVSAETIRDDVLAGAAVCRWAVRNGLLKDNPFAGMAPSPGGNETDKREGYTDEEAARILKAARKETGWKRWLPWLLAFTGARLGEVAELQRKNVRQEGGVWILDFVPTVNRRGKTRDFQRMVPLHPAVLAEGFLGYVQGLPADPNGPLFPDLLPASDGKRSTTAQTQHMRWMRNTVGITAPNKAPAHSWRHRMEDELRKVRALPEVQDAITGRRNPRNAGAGYGKGFRGMPEEVLKELARIPSPVPSRG